MAKQRSKSGGRKTKSKVRAVRARTNGKSNGVSVKSNGVATNERVQTVTFRIPVQLKKSVEEAARSRGMTTTRFVVEALESEVNEEPPRWWRKKAADEGAEVS